MCGIISAFIGNKVNVTKLEVVLKQMIFMDTIRGYDSTGIFYGNQGESPEVYKKALPGYDFLSLRPVQKVLNQVHTYSFFVGHNRAATKGMINPQNAHPFQHDHITGVHNGTLWDYRHLTKDVFSTDSEHIFKALSETDNPKDVIEELDGAFALLWHNAKTNSIHFIRNSDRPYYFCKIKDMDLVLGASEKGMLEWILGRDKIELEIEEGFHPKEMIEYRFDLNNVCNIAATTKHHEYTRMYWHTGTSKKGQGSNNNNNNNLQSVNRDLDLSEKGKEIIFTLIKYEQYNSATKYGKYTGYSPEGNDVVIHGAKDDDFDLKTPIQFTGKIRYKQKIDGTKEYLYSIDPETVVEYTAEYEDDEKIEAYEECQGCQDMIPVHKTIYHNDTPLCSECAMYYQNSNYMTGS